MVRCYLLATNSLFDRYWIATLDLASKGSRLPATRAFRVALPPEDPSAPDLPLNAGDDRPAFASCQGPVAKPADDNGSPGDPPARPRPPGGQISAVFVSETGCARALLGWSQNTLVYAAGLGRVKDA